MPAVLTPEERAAFKSCRRAWDLGARGRRNLEPEAIAPTLDVDRALRDALAVYYFPGMWDWTRAVVIPLVFQALDDAVTRQRDRIGPSVPPNFAASLEAARAVLDAYAEWAPGVERFAPVLVEVDYLADLENPDQSGTGLFTPSGASIRYQGRLDMLAVDEHDAYWVVRHRVVKEWTSQDALARDEEAIAACWAWEHFYIGMEIAGTIHNELRLPTSSPITPAASDAAVPEDDRRRGGLAQSEGSGGGRSVPTHRRLYARATEPAQPERVAQDVGPWFRRTWLRRSREEIAQAGTELAMDACELFRPDVAVYPSPSEAACRRCPFSAPCLALYEGRDTEADAILASSYRPRADEEPAEGRLGGVTWSIGRGAAPPTFGRR